MLNILVPTDFSDLSKVALQYAIRIAKNLNGMVTLLHIVESNNVLAVNPLKKGKVAQIRKAKDELSDLVREASIYAKSKVPIAIDMAKKTSSFHESVNAHAKRIKSGLIVIGTHGASGFKKTFLGSNTTSLMEITDIPMVVVPDQADLRTIENVIYATDLKYLDYELNTLVSFAEKFNATVHVLHILKPGEVFEEAEARIDEAVKKLSYRKVLSLVTFDEDVDEAISQYINVSSADMLAMFSHRPSFYEKIFDKSVTRKMAFHGTIPLLVFRQKSN